MRTARGDDERRRENKAEEKERKSKLKAFADFLATLSVAKLRKMVAVLNRENKEEAELNHEETHYTIVLPKNPTKEQLIKELRDAADGYSSEEAVATAKKAVA